MPDAAVTSVNCACGGVGGGGGGGGLVAAGALPPPPPQEAIIDPRPRATMSAMVKECQKGRHVSCVFIMLFRISTDQKISSAPRLDQVHDHDVAVAERKMIGVALLLHALDLRHILKKHR